MVKDFYRLYEIGRKLGLTKKEIHNLSLFGSTKHPTLYTILLIISIVSFGILIIFLGIHASRSIYPSGARYSTIRIKDFKKRK